MSSTAWRRRPPGAGRGRTRAPVSYAMALAVPAAATLLMTSVTLLFNAVEASLVYLLLTVAVALVAGFGPAVVASLTSTLLLNYDFLPPVHTLTIANPANWFALFTFLAASAITSRLVTAARQHSTEAAARAAEAMRLNELARALLAAGGPPEGRRAALEAASRLLEADAQCFAALDESGLRLEPADAMTVAWRSVLEAALRAGLRGEVARRAGPGGGVLVLLPLPGGANRDCLAAAYGLASDVPPASTLEPVGSLLALAVERARLQQEALDAELLRKSEAAKTALLSSVSHDLRTPLGAARIAATALQDPAVWADGAMRAELLSTLEESTARLNRALGNVLDMSRLGSGGLRLRARPCALSEVVAAAIEAVGPGRLGQRLQVDIAPEVPPLRCDVGLLTSALANLLDNAVKYAPGDSPIEVSAAAAPGGGVRLTVGDRGCGLTPGEEAAVFEAFRRGSRCPGAGGPVGGMGLGLSIVRGLVEAHGGSVSLANRPGGGAEAVILLPRDGPPVAGMGDEVGAEVRGAVRGGVRDEGRGEVRDGVRTGGRADGETAAGPPTQAAPAGSTEDRARG